jgi:hypothetical protein
LAVISQPHRITAAHLASESQHSGDRCTRFDPHAHLALLLSLAHDVGKTTARVYIAHAQTNEFRGAQAGIKQGQDSSIIACADGHLLEDTTGCVRSP